MPSEHPSLKTLPGRHRFVVALFCSALLPAAAQEKLGIANSNYSSTNSIFLNPSSSVDSKTYMQLNLVGANAFVMSSLAYVPHFWLYGHKGEPYVQQLQVSSMKLPKFLYGYGTIDGPAFVISKMNYGAGFFVRARSVANVRISSTSLANALITQENTTGPVSLSANIKNSRLSNMSWIEYGGNFGRMIKKNRENLWTAGASLRYISGINLLYGNLQQLKGSYTDTMIDIQSIRGKVRFNEAALNSGRGIGADIGITYKKMLEPVDNYYTHSVRGNCKNIDYKYKAGLVLRDLGYIRFKKNTSSATINSTGGTYHTNRPDTSYRAPLEQILNSSFSNGPITASLPTALVGQFDWNFENSIYLNATVIKNLVPNAFTGVQGPDLLSICPRFERQQFEAAVPFTFQKYIYPQMGLALRYRTFVIGTDNIFPFVLRKNTYGVNLYFSLGISLFKNPACKQKTIKPAECAQPRTKIKRRKKSV